MGDELRKFRDEARKRSEAEAQVLERHHGLVVGIANRLGTYLHLHMEREDLIAYGQMGLLDAHRRYDATSRSSFSSYAYYRIRGSMLDGCRIHGWDTRQRTSLRFGSLEKLNELMEDHVVSTVDAPEVRTLRDGVERVASLVGDSLMVVLMEHHSFEGMLVEEIPPQERGLDERERNRKLALALEQLSEEERLVLKRYYYYGHSLQDIADDLNKSKSWCSRIHARALARVREIMCSEAFLAEHG